MTKRLSSDTLNQLEPLLGSLARMVASGSQLNTVELQTVLMGTDVDSEPAMAELERWSRLLKALREKPTAERRRATAEALQLRGLSEAAVLLAVNAVTEGGSMPTVAPAAAKVSRLKVNIDRLDFGTLKSGLPAIGEFEVEGGPGEITVDNPLVSVAPSKFAAGRTHVRVEAKPVAGGVILATIRLIMVDETIQVSLVAQWQEPPTVVAPNPFVFRNGRSASSLEELVSQCVQSPDDAIYHLREGHLETWLAYVGLHDLVPAARNARLGGGSDHERLKRFLDATGVPHHFQPSTVPPPVGVGATAPPAVLPPPPTKPYTPPPAPVTPTSSVLRWVTPGVMLVLVGACVGVICIGAVFFYRQSQQQSQRAAAIAQSTKNAATVATATAAAILTNMPLPTEPPPPTQAPPPQPTLLRTPTQAPAPTAALKCSIEVTGEFRSVWEHAGGISAGCPTGKAYTKYVAYQPFQNGFMLWRGGPQGDPGGMIYVFYNSGSGEAYADRWVEGMPESGDYSPPSDLLEPVRGFGYVWRNQLGGPKAQIGWAQDGEAGADGGLIQDFANGGVIFRYPGMSPVFLMSNHRWVR